MTSRLSPAHRPLADILYRALAEPIGLSIQPAGEVDGRSLQQRFYLARRETRDPALEDLALRQRPDGAIWIFHKTITISQRALDQQVARQRQVELEALL